MEIALASSFLLSRKREAVAIAEMCVSQPSRLVCSCRPSTKQNLVGMARHLDGLGNPLLVFCRIRRA